MIVTCDACETHFTVDDSRIPPEGIKVRCSKCKHVFMVKRETAEELASEFNDFERFHRDQMEKEGATDEGGVTEVAEKPARIEEERADFSFEEFMKTQEPAQPEVQEEIPAGVEIPEAPVHHEASLKEEELPEEVATPPPVAPEPVEEGVLIEDEEPKLSAEAFFREEMEREAEDQARDVSLLSLKEKRFEDLIQGKGTRKRPVRRRSSLRMILLLILLLIVGAVAYFWWQNEEASVTLIENIGPTLKTGVAKVAGLWEDVLGSRKEGLELSGLEGYEEKIGQHRIYVIKGQVTNQSRRARKYVKLRVIILDQAGNRIKEKVIFCGNVFSREELEKLSPKFFTGDEILQPKRPKDMVVEPDKTISFMAIFSGLPREGKNFKVEKLEAPTV